MRSEGSRSPKAVVREIRRKARRKYSPEEKTEKVMLLPEERDGLSSLKQSISSDAVADREDALLSLEDPVVKDQTP